MRKVIALVLATVTVSAGAPTQREKLIAEGDYVARGKNGPKRLAHWRLWRLDNGSYEVRETPGNSSLIVQTFRFDAQFFPVGYSLNIHGFPKRPGSPGSMNVSCRYDPTEIQCAGDYEGHKSVASAKTAGPSVFIPGEFYSLDFCWFQTEFMQVYLQKRVLPEVYILADADGNRNDIALKKERTAGGPGPVFEGSEDLEIWGKKQLVRKYKSGGPDETSVLRVTPKGIVVSMGSDRSPDHGFAFALENYREYAPWGEELLN